MKTDNDRLKEALKERDEVINGLSEFDIDDEQRKKIQRFLKLSPLERDIFYLSSQHTHQEIGDMYGVSRAFISKKIKTIQNQLREEI